MATAPCKIVAIDDVPGALLVLEQSLCSAVPDVLLQSATAGAQGLALAIAEDPDAILIAITHGEGLALCRQMQADSWLSDIPVLFLVTPATAPAQRIAALAAGAAGFLTLPLQPQDLIAQLRLMVRLKAADRSAQVQRAARDTIECQQAQAAILGSEMRLRAAERVAHTGHYEIDIATGLAVWSDETYRIFGLAPDSPPPTVDAYAQLIHPADRAKLYQLFGKSVAEGVPFDLEYRIVHADGEIRYVHSLGNLIQDAAGQTKMFGTFQDITERRRAEEALRKSEAGYRQMVDTALEGIWAMDAQRRTTFVNAHLAEMLHFAPAEMIGRPVEDFMYPEDLGDHHERMQSRYRGLGDHYERRFRSKDGKEVWAIVSATALTDSEGRFGGSFGMFTDITARKEQERQLLTAQVELQRLLTEADQSRGALRQLLAEQAATEQALRESEERYRNLLEQAPIGIAVHCGEVIVFTNPAGARLLGAESPAQLVGRPIADFVHPAYYQQLRARAQRMFAGEHDLAPAEYRFVRLDGEPVDVEVTGTLLTYQGKQAVQIIVRDVSAWKYAELERARLLAQVQAQAQQIAQILDTIPQGVLLLDQAGRVLLANPTGVRDLQVLAGAAVGERIVHLGNLSLVDLLNSAPSGPWHEIRHEQSTFEAIARPIATALSEIADDLAAGQWVVVIDDVTQQRAVRGQLQQQERLAAVGQLAAGIAHDFNNILAIITLQSYLATHMPDLPAPLAERLAIIGKQTANAAVLIQQILDFSRRAVLERQPLDLLSLLREQVKLLARTLPENIQVDLAYEPGEYVVLADPTRIQQMVMNLAVNARDAMPQGGMLRLTLARADAPSRPGLAASPWIRLTVADSGTGIAAEAHAHLFEPFFTTKPRGQGTGLGLAQVYGIVKQHAGEIAVDSTAGQGAIFTILLPAVASPAPVVVAPAAEPAQGDGATILLVEDNAILLEAMSDIIDMLGYTVIGVGNGRDALAMLEARTRVISLVVTDLIMPQMGGDALLKAMRDRGLTTPVIILSGHPLEGELAALKAQGLAGWLVKPPSIQDLAQLLAQALAQ